MSTLEEDKRPSLCMAACTGIDSADLKYGSFRHVMRQRDELLEALEYVMNRLVDPHETADAATNARAAIAKVEGGAK